MPFKQRIWNDDLLPGEHPWARTRVSEVAPPLQSALPNHSCVGCGLWVVGGVHYLFPRSFCLFVCFSQRGGPYDNCIQHLVLKCHLKIQLRDSCRSPNNSEEKQMSSPF